MAGSIKNFIYTTDEGDTFILRADESNVEAAGGAVDLTGGTSALYGMPKGLKPRYARYRNAAGTIARNCYLCTEAATPTTPIIDQVSGESLDLVKIYSEERTFFIGVDTGLTDGDAS